MTDPGTIKKTCKYRLDTTDAILQMVLHTFHPAEKKQAGMYFTPLPVVRFIVDSIDLILKKYFPFTGEAGLANPWVTALDPAAGSFIFPLEVIKRVWQYFQKNDCGRGRCPVQLLKSYLSRQLCAVEISDKLHLAGYTRLAQEFLKMGLAPGLIKKANFVLGNALDMPDALKEKITGNRLRTSIRRAEPSANGNAGGVMVVLGNPPYATYPANKTAFIENLVKLYKEDVRGERNLQPLSLDYIRFIRLAHWLIEQVGQGVIGFVVNRSFLWGLIHRGMRKKLSESFDKIYILDLHGDVLENKTTAGGQKDENIFKIKQGVAIAFFIKTGLYSSTAGTREEIFFAEQWGAKREKFHYLEKHTIFTVDWQRLKPVPPYYFLEKKNLPPGSCYESFFSLCDIFAVNSQGIKTHRDELVTGFSKEELIEKLGGLPPNLAKKITGVSLDEVILPYHYRPFDMRYICYLPGLIERDRRAVLKNFLGENIGLCVMRQFTDSGPGGYNHVLCVGHMIDSRFLYSTRGTAVVFPLFLYPDEGENGNRVKDGFGDEADKEKLANFQPGFLEKIETVYRNRGGRSVTPYHILYYIYAVLHAGVYREKYGVYLEIDYPRIPFSGDVNLFWEMAGLGEKLVKLHLMESEELTGESSRFESSGDHVVHSVIYNEKKRQVMINCREYFSPVDKEVWEYKVGGYQVLYKWLKDRASRYLSKEEIRHYTGIIEILEFMIQYRPGINRLYSMVEKTLINEKKNHWALKKDSEP